MSRVDPEGGTEKNADSSGVGSVLLGSSSDSNTSRAPYGSAAWPGIASPSRRTTTIAASTAESSTVGPGPSAAGLVKCVSFKTREDIRVLSTSFASIGNGLDKVWAHFAFLRGPSSWVKTIPGVFTGVSNILDGVGDIWEGSSEVMNAICTCSLSLPTVHRGVNSNHKPHRLLHCSSSYGLQSILDYHILTRNHIDSRIILYENGLRIACKGMLPGVYIIRTMLELTTAVDNYKSGTPVQLVDISEDVSLDLALEMWTYLLSMGAIGLVRLESSLSHMAKRACFLKEEEKRIQNQILNLRVKIQELHVAAGSLSKKLGEASRC